MKTDSVVSAGLWHSELQKQYYQQREDHTLCYSLGFPLLSDMQG